VSELRTSAANYCGRRKAWANRPRSGVIWWSRAKSASDISCCEGWGVVTHREACGRKVVQISNERICLQIPHEPAKAIAWQISTEE
jgi:hypothetical protein